jgi:hypothetical protein
MARHDRPGQAAYRQFTSSYGPTTSGRTADTSRVRLLLCQASTLRRHRPATTRRGRPRACRIPVAEMYARADATSRGWITVDSDRTRQCQGPSEHSRLAVPTGNTSGAGRSTPFRRGPGRPPPPPPAASMTPTSGACSPAAPDLTAPCHIRSSRGAPRWSGSSQRCRGHATGHRGAHRSGRRMADPRPPLPVRRLDGVARAQSAMMAPAEGADALNPHTIPRDVAASSGRVLVVSHACTVKPDSRVDGGAASA